MTAITHEATVESVCDALLRASEAFAGALRSVADPTRPAVGVWNIAETAAHVSQSAPYFLAAARSEAQLERLEENAAATRAWVDAEPERRLDVLAERVVRGERELVGYARAVGSDPMVAPFERVSTPLSAMLAIELAELLVHGFDVARAARLPWRIDPADAAMALDGAVSVLPALLDPGTSPAVRVSCDLRIRHGRRWRIAVESGALTLSRADAAPVDCHVRVDPVAFLLLSFHRISPLRPVLTGQLLLWGRRPWAFARLQGLLRSV